MVDDYEIKRTIWDGKVPVEFVLDQTEFAIHNQQSYFVMLPRISYFPLCLPKVLQFFQNNVDEIDDVNVNDIWSTSNGTILKFNYPIGVLYDLHVADNGLPWVVSLRFKNFPNELVRCNAQDSMKHYFIQTIKEADQLKHRGSVIAAMKAEEHVQLFQSIVNDKFDDFWHVNKKLMDSSDVKQFNVPMRFYLADSPFKQFLITTLTEDGEENTLMTAIKKALPEIDTETVDVVSHGIRIPLDSPVLWLAKNVSYPDNFVHLVVRMRTSI